MTTTAVANQKGGVAKTTSVHALGVAMAERGAKVLLVDLDPQASLSWACGVDPDSLELSIHDVLLNRAKVPDVLITLEPPAPATPGGPVGVLHLLPSTIDLAGAELHLLTKTGPTNAAVFLPDSVDHYGLGAYVNYDCPRESIAALLDALATASRSNTH